MSAPTTPTTPTITAKVAVALLKSACEDYNYWGESESDSPLVIKRTKSVFDDKRILSLDASARKKSSGEEGYKPPERTIRRESLEQTFRPIIENCFDQVPLEEFKNGGTIESLKVPIEQIEYYTQLYSVFNLLDMPEIMYVEDTEGDPYTGLFICGKSSDGETVYAQGLLVQT